MLRKALAIATLLNVLVLASPAQGVVCVPGVTLQDEQGEIRPQVQEPVAC